MELKKPYMVTELAGDHVGGIRVPDTGIVEMTPTQAYYEVLKGVVTLKTDDKPATKKK